MKDVYIKNKEKELYKITEEKDGDQLN